MKMIAGGGDDGLGLRAQRPYARVLPGCRAFSSSPPNAVPQAFAFQLPGQMALFRTPSLAQRLCLSEVCLSVALSLCDVRGFALFGHLRTNCYLLEEGGLAPPLLRSDDATEIPCAILSR
jgi:hypothetical protein